jgi:hypothetical protein
MNDIVELYYKRNRGWPWPEDSWGLTPMFGEDGWCRSCGVPNRPQSGSIVLQSKGITVEGAWVPNWQFDAICVERSLAELAAARFDLDMVEVKWRTTAPGEAMQIVVPTIGTSWFDRDELHAKAVERHGVAGARCSECGLWRWMPLGFGLLPPLRITPPLDDVAIAASPEWFGDGWKAFRQIVMRRELADLLAKASPRDFAVKAVA